MAKSLAQIEKQIEKLKKEADALRAKEIEGVVSRIKDAIAHYQLTPAELFDAPAKRRRAAKAPAKKPAAAVKYRDENGNAWSGIGKRPNWFKAALAAGRTAEDLLVK